MRLQQLGVQILARSHLYETPSWPDPAEPAFVNAVTVVNTTLQPVELLALLHGVETAFGRMRSAPNAPRTLDIDLLDYDGRVVTDGVTLPHPRMTERSFVLVPLAEVAPDVFSVWALCADAAVSVLGIGFDFWSMTMFGILAATASGFIWLSRR